MHDEACEKVVWRCNPVPVDPADPSKGVYNLLDDEIPKTRRAGDGEKTRGTAPRNPAERRLKSSLEKQGKKEE